MEKRILERKRKETNQMEQKEQEKKEKENIGWNVKNTKGIEWKQEE